MISVGSEDGHPDIRYNPAIEDILSSPLHSTRSGAGTGKEKSGTGQVKEVDILVDG